MKWSDRLDNLRVGYVLAFELVLIALTVATAALWVSQYPRNLCVSEIAATGLDWFLTLPDMVGCLVSH